MRTIAYKIADGTLVANSLPSGWITEHTFVDEQPEGTINAKDGWLFIPDDQFEELKAASNSDEKMQAFQEAKRIAQIEASKAFNEAAEAMKIKQEADEKEMAEFLAWKASK